MAASEVLFERLKSYVGEQCLATHIQYNEITLEIARDQLKAVCLILRDTPELKFEMLMDVCGVDYLHYGLDEWSTDDATSTGFERGVSKLSEVTQNHRWHKPRFAVVYHLLSITHNWRVRLKVFLPETDLIVETVNDIWPSANWFEREAFDLFGILFTGHPDLRRILTDYGFIGHPFRKDFPLIGEVAMRYDAKAGRVVYEPVDIEPRTLVPKTIRAVGEEKAV